MTIYLMICIFVFGMFCGSVADSKDKPVSTHWVIMFLMAAVWPFMIYIYWKERQL